MGEEPMACFRSLELTRALGGHMRHWLLARTSLGRPCVPIRWL